MESNKESNKLQVVGLGTRLIVEEELGRRGGRRGRGQQGKPRESHGKRESVIRLGREVGQ